MSIPIGWKSKNLGEVATLQRGFDLPEQNRVPGIVPIVSSSGTTGFHNEWKVNPPGIVTGRYGTIGEVFFVEVDFWPLNTSLWVKDFHGNNYRYIYYLLKSLDYKKLSDKTGVPGINRNDVHKLKVALPPLREQCRIAEILGVWDESIDLLEKLITAKTRLNQALVQQLSTGRKRFREFEGSDWKTARLDNVCQFIKDGTHGTHERLDNGIPLLSATNITKSGQVNFDNASMISEKDYNKIHAKYEIQENDFLLTVVGTIGRSAMVKNLPKFTLQRSVAIIRVDSRKIMPIYLYCISKSFDFQNQMKKRSNTTAQTGVYLGELEKISVLLPSLPEQEKIAAVLSAADTEISTLEKQLATYKEQKRGLMQQLLTGRTRILGLEDEEDKEQK